MNPQKRDAAVMLSATGGAVGLGLGTAYLPIEMGGLFGFSILLLSPWGLLFALMGFFALVQSPIFGPAAGISVGGFTFSVAHLILIPFAIRAYFFTKQDLRLHWGKPEWLLFSFGILQPLITFKKAPIPHDSLGALGLMAMGLLAYAAVYVATCNHRRMLLAAKAFLWAILIDACFGILSELMHLAIGINVGISTRSAYGNGVYGFNFEHDIFASTTAAGAIAFYVLWRERNTIFSRRIAGIGIWLCGGAALLGLSRGAWLGFAFAFAALLILPRPEGVRIRGVERVGITVLLFTVAGFGVVYALGSSNPIFAGIQAKMINIVNIHSGSGAARLDETATALDDWKSSKLVGLGVGTYNQHHPQKSQTNYIGDLYLRTLNESGIVGVLLFGSFLLLLFFPNKALLKYTGELGPVARALTGAGAVCLVAYAATDVTLYVWPWILFGLIRASRSLVNKEFAAIPKQGVIGSMAPPPTGYLVPDGNGHGLLPAPAPAGLRR